MSVIVAVRGDQVDRRRWPRAAVRIPIRVVDTEDTFRVLIGETIDVGVGGVRAVLDGPLFGTIEASVHLDLDGFGPLVCQALVADGGAIEDGWEYRLAFRDLEPREVRALANVVARSS